MPIYEYQCEDCGTEFEKLVRRSGGHDEVACPSCGDQHLSLRLSTFAAHANGHANGRAEVAPMPTCPGGMCQTPDFCGRN